MKKDFRCQIEYIYIYIYINILMVENQKKQDFLKNIPTAGQPVD